MFRSITVILFTFGFLCHETSHAISLCPPVLARHLARSSLNKIFSRLNKKIIPAHLQHVLYVGGYTDIKVTERGYEDSLQNIWVTATRSLREELIDARGRMSLTKFTYMVERFIEEQFLSTRLQHLYKALSTSNGDRFAFRVSTTIDPENSSKRLPIELDGVVSGEVSDEIDESVLELKRQFKDLSIDLNTHDEMWEPYTYELYLRLISELKHANASSTLLRICEAFNPSKNSNFTMKQIYLIKRGALFLLRPEYKESEILCDPKTPD